jgi:polysaccharide export outer membrane protein
MGMAGAALAGVLAVLNLGCTTDGVRSSLPHRPAPLPAASEGNALPAPAQGGGIEAGATNAPDGMIEPGRVLRSGDRLVVTIYAPPEPFNSQHVVDEQGRINLPFIGAVSVAGKSCARAQQEIEKEYIDQKYYKTVTVIIVPPESEYSVSGEVIRPGPYPLTRNQTLLQALAKAGRLTEYGDPNRVFLIRGGVRMEINVKEIREGKRKDIVIIPGDVIEVPRSWY